MALSVLTHQDVTGLSKCTDNMRESASKTDMMKLSNLLNMDKVLFREKLQNMFGGWAPGRYKKTVQVKKETSPKILADYKLSAKPCYAVTKQGGVRV